MQIYVFTAQGHDAINDLVALYSADIKFWKWAVIIYFLREESLR